MIKFNIEQCKQETPWWGIEPTETCKDRVRSTQTTGEEAAMEEAGTSISPHSSLAQEHHPRVERSVCSMRVVLHSKTRRALPVVCPHDPIVEFFEV